MISWRNYVSMGIMMIVLLFLFQFSQVIKENANQYDKNEYIEDTNLDVTNKWEMKYTQAQQLTKDAEYILWIGEEMGDMQQVVNQWAYYTKQNMVGCTSLAQWDELTDVEPEMIVVQSAYLTGENDVSLLKQMASNGIHVVFCDLPDVKELKANPQLMELLGIAGIEATTTKIEGVKIFSGFLIGGEVIYQAENEKEEEKRQDLDLEVPWYRLENGTKTYMVGLMDEEEMEEQDIENEDIPALIWSNHINKGMVFAVNGDYMKDVTGIGMLSAMSYEAREYYIYPVVNAQNLIVSNYSAFSMENEEKMQELYCRNQVGVYRDIIWPALMATAENSKFKLSCFYAPQLNYRDGAEPDADYLIFYLKQLKEQSAEAGMSMVCLADGSIRVKLKSDETFFQSADSTYLYGAAYTERSGLDEVLKVMDSPILKDVKTITCDFRQDKPLLGYCTETVTLQSVTNNALEHTFSADLRMRSIQTTLAYTSIGLDMQKISWPESEEDSWEKVYEEYSSAVNTYWKQFEMFDRTTISESDSRVRYFLTADYHEYRIDNKLYVKLDQAGDEASFILRTHDEKVTHIKGGTYEKMEKNAYLIRADEKELEITLESLDKLKYTLE